MGCQCPNGVYSPLIRDCTGNIRSLGWNETLTVNGMPVPETVLEANLDLYIDPYGSDTTGLGTATRPFKSIYRAHDEVLKYDPGDYDITIHVGDGVYLMDRSFIPVWLYGGHTQIIGNADVIASAGFPATMTAADTAASNDADYAALEYIDCEFQLDANYDAILADMTTNMFVAILAASGGTNPTKVYGWHEILSIDVGTRTIELRIWRKNGDALIPSGAVSVTNAIVFRSVFKYPTVGDGSGIFCSGIHGGCWSNIILKGNKDYYDNYYGIKIKSNGAIEAEYVGVHCFNNGVYCDQGVFDSNYAGISKIKTYGQHFLNPSSHSFPNIQVTGYGTDAFREYKELTNTCYHIGGTIGGGYANTIDSDSTYGTIAGGRNNEIDGSYDCTIGGGYSNIITGGGYESVIAGGYNHTITGASAYSAILGGKQHTITTSLYGLIIGGYINSISSNNAVIISGQTNVIGTTCVGAFIGGGLNNNITAVASSSHYSGVILASNCTITDSDGVTIGGGYSHEILDDSEYSGIFGGHDHSINTDSTYCFIGGGNQNIITDSLKSSILGGNENTLSGRYSAIVGGTLNIVDASYGYIGAGCTNTVYATGGTVINGTTCDVEVNCNYSAIVTGINNEIKDTAEYAVIASGEGNRIQQANKSFIGTGYVNKIGTFGHNCAYSAIVSGHTNELQDGLYGFIGSGYNNEVGTETGAVCCAIVNGYMNRIEGGNYSTIFTGYTNTIAYTSAVCSYSLILGGRENTITDANYCTVASGRYHTITAGAHYSAIGNGYYNSAAEYCEFVIGYQAAAINYSEQAHATNCHDTTRGSAQTSVMVVANTTTDDTWTALYTDNTAKNMNMPPNAAWSFRALVTGQKTDGSQAGGYELTGCVRRDGAGNATAVGTLPTTGTVLGEDDANWDCRAVVTGTALRIEVLGVAATTINWTARVEVTQVIVES